MKSESFVYYKYLLSYNPVTGKVSWCAQYPEGIISNSLAVFVALTKQYKQMSPNEVMLGVTLMNRVLQLSVHRRIRQSEQEADFIEYGKLGRAIVEYFNELEIPILV